MGAPDSLPGRRSSPAAFCAGETNEMNDVVYVQKVLEQPNELEQQSVLGQPNALEQPRLLKQRLLLGALRALRKGDFSVRLPRGLTGIEGEIRSEERRV